MEEEEEDGDDDVLTCKTTCVKVKVKFRLSIERWRERKVKVLDKRQVVLPKGEPRLESGAVLLQVAASGATKRVLIGCSYPAGQTFILPEKCKGMRRSKNNEKNKVE